MKLKKIALFVGGVLALLAAAAIAIPLFVDVDRYRPQILKRANAMVNGRVELGKLKLSLWGRVQIDAAGLEIQDVRGRKVVSVSDASFVLPFSTILSGSPQLTLVLARPSIEVVRDAQGVINVMTLVKQPSAAPSPGAAASGTTAAPASEVVVPAFVARSRLGFEIRDGSLKVVDEKSKFESTVDRLQVRLRDASLIQPTTLTVEAALDTKLGQQLRVAGPVRLEMDTAPVFSGTELREMKASLRAGAGALEIGVPGLFEKKAGIPLSLDGKIALGKDEARIDSLKAVFHNAVATISGKIGPYQPEPKLDLKVSSNAVELQPWGELVPMLRDYKISGRTTLALDLAGAASALRYGGSVKLESIGFTHPMFKADPRLDGSIQIATNQLEKIAMRMKAPGCELQVSGKLVDFSKPVVTLAATSPGMDLDQWLDLAKPAAGVKPAAGAGAKGSPTAAAARDLDALLAPLRASAVALATEARLEVRLDRLKARQAPMQNVKAQATLKNLAVSLDSASLQAFGGRVEASGRLDLKPSRPTYLFNAKVEGVEIEKAVESQVAFLKNTLLGRLGATASGSGSSFNVDSAIQALDLNGSFEVRQARFATMDITKMAFEGINGALARVAEKVPALKGRQLGAPANRESAYEFIRSSFQLSGGRFSAPNFEAKAEKGKGIDLQGRVAVDLKDLSLDTKFQLVDTYNLTRARDLSADLAGVQVPAILAEKGKPVVIPVTVGCQVSKPCPSFTELPEHFARVALSNLTGSAKEKVKSEAKQKIGEAIKKALPGGLNRLFR